MNIYLVTRNDDTDYDEYAGFVIEAADEEIIRKTIIEENKYYGCHGGNLDIQLIGTGLLPDSEKIRIHLEDFRAG
jgi:hypothetical protein